MAVFLLAMPLAQADSLSVDEELAFKQKTASASVATIKIAYQYDIQSGGRGTSTHPAGWTCSVDEYEVLTEPIPRDPLTRMVPGYYYAVQCAVPGDGYCCMSSRRRANGDIEVREEIVDSYCQNPVVAVKTGNPLDTVSGGAYCSRDYSGGGVVASCSTRPVYTPPPPLGDPGASAGLAGASAQDVDLGSARPACSDETLGRAQHYVHVMCIGESDYSLSWAVSCTFEHGTVRSGEHRVVMVIGFGDVAPAPVTDLLEGAAPMVDGLADGAVEAADAAVEEARGFQVHVQHG